jgi:hypothetical protein
MEKKFSYESLTMISYQWSFEIFWISLTIFDSLAENRFDGYGDAPSRENIFIGKPDPDFLIVVC